MTAQSRDWADYGERGCAAKLHVVFDPAAALPVHFVVTPARINDITPAKAMPVEAGATYVFDLGYYDFSWWAALDAQGCRFITRLKTHTRPMLIQEREVETGGNIIADRIIRLADRLARNRRNPLDRPLREIHVRIDTGKTLRLVSNDLDASAHEIADLYKMRWQIELFFRWVKQPSRSAASWAPRSTPSAPRSPPRSSPTCCCAWHMPRKGSSPAFSPSHASCVSTSCTSEQSRNSQRHRPSNQTPQLNWI